MNILSRQFQPLNLENSSSKDQAIFKIKNLSVMYDRKIAIQDIDLEIPKNKITAIIGPSGCGKSTLITCIKSNE